MAVKHNEHEIPGVFTLASQYNIDEVRIKTAQLYDFKNGYIDVDNFQEVDVISYQIPTNFHEYLKGKKSVQFLTRGRNDLFEIIN